MLIHRVLVLAVVLAACDGSDHGERVGDGYLRADVVKVYAGQKANRPGCTSESQDACTTFENVLVSDLDVEGDRIAILRMFQLETVTLFVSEDAGGSWRSYVFDGGLAVDLTWDLQMVGVHLQGERTFLMYTIDLGGIVNRLAMAELTLDDARMERLGVPDGLTWGFNPVKRPDGQLRWWQSIGDELPGLVEYDPATQALSDATRNLPCAGRACRAHIGMTPDGGETYDSHTEVTEPEAAEPVCRVHWDPAVGMTQRCVPREIWPGTDSEFVTRTVLGGEDGREAYVAWSTPGTDSQAYATAISFDRQTYVTDTIPLGIGQIPAFHTGSRFQRPRFGDLEYIQAEDWGGGAVGRLVRIGPDGPEEAHFRLTPCVVDDGCGYVGGPNFGMGLIQWIHPLGDGDYLVFYTVQSESNDNQQTMYVGRDRPTFTPIVASGPLPMSTQPGNDVAPLYTQAMTPLQTACIAYASCADDPALYPACIQYYSKVYDSSRPGLYAARDRFTAAQGCAALQAAWPEGIGVTAECSSTCIESGGTCAGGTGACSTYVAGGDLASCGQCDGDFNVFVCNETQVYSAPCGGGGNQYCSPDQPNQPGGCWRPGLECGGEGCRRCAPGETLVAQYEDCGAQGGTGCVLQDVVPNEWECESTSLLAEPCIEDTFGRQCSGPYIMTCDVGIVAQADCRTLGFDGCVTLDAGVAICQ